MIETQKNKRKEKILKKKRFLGIKKDTINKWSSIISDQAANVPVINKWSSISDQQNYICGTDVATSSTSIFNSITFPIVRRVAAHTIAGGYYEESDERIKKRKRILKLKRVLNNEDFNEIVSSEEYSEILIEKKDVFKDGLISVTPLNIPTGSLMYMDFCYKDKKKEREDKLKRVLKTVLKT